MHWTCERNYLENKATDRENLFKYFEATIAIFEDNMFHGFAIFEELLPPEADAEANLYMYVYIYIYI